MLKYNVPAATFISSHVDSSSARIRKGQRLGRTSYSLASLDIVIPMVCAVTADSQHALALVEMTMAEAKKELHVMTGSRV
jgi:hypothetical protein